VLLRIPSFKSISHEAIEIKNLLADNVLTICNDTFCATRAPSNEGQQSAEKKNYGYNKNRQNANGRNA
jgi:hypothetical protein